MTADLLLGTGRRIVFGPFGGVMGILNVTPDSFFDGGRFPEAEAATLAGVEMAGQGVSVIDVGGESTRPRGDVYGRGAPEVSLDEELARVIPVVEGIRAADPRVPIAVDTRKAGVARAALDAGADAVNLVTGLDAPAELLALVASRGAAIVLNHCRGTPSTTFAVSCFSDDVVGDVAADLARAHEAALQAGIPPDRVFLDPGLGFGKTPGQCFELLLGLPRLSAPGVPLVVGASRKAFLGSVSGASPGERLPESLAAVAVAAKGLSSRNPLLHRVHDTSETVRFLAVLSRAPGTRPAR